MELNGALSNPLTSDSHLQIARLAAAKSDTSIGERAPERPSQRLPRVVRARSWRWSQASSRTRLSHCLSETSTPPSRNSSESLSPTRQSRNSLSAQRSWRPSIPTDPTRLLRALATKRPTRRTRREHGRASDCCAHSLDPRDSTRVEDSDELRRVIDQWTKAIANCERGVHTRTRVGAPKQAHRRNRSGRAVVRRPGASGRRPRERNEA